MNPTDYLQCRAVVVVDRALFCVFVLLPDALEATVVLLETRELILPIMKTILTISKNH